MLRHSWTTHNPGPLSDLGVFSADDSDVEQQSGGPLPGLPAGLQPHRLRRRTAAL